MPPPVPPSVKDGRMITGSRSALHLQAYSMLCAIPERAEPRPIWVNGP